MYMSMFSLKQNKNKKSIPKIIHQVWLGPKEPPYIFINTWILFCNKYKWEHKLWREADIAKLKLKNKKLYENAKSYQQKSDIARYEIMYKYGGVYLDADMIWLKSDLGKYLPINNVDFIGVQEPFSCISYKYIKTPFIANGFFGCSKGNSIMKKCIKTIPNRINVSSKAFITTGPGLLNSVIDIPISIVPTPWVFPMDFRGLKTTENIDKFIGKSLVFTKTGFELLGYPKNIQDVPNIVLDYINRLLYV